MKPRSETSKEDAVKTHSERSMNSNGDYTETDTTEREDGAKEVVTASKSTAKHWTNKGQTTTTRRGRSVDPAGSGKKEKVELIEKIETNPNGTKKTRVTRKVNGETVSERTRVIR